MIFSTCEKTFSREIPGKTKTEKNLLKKMTNPGRFFVKPKKFSGGFKLVDECH